MSALSGTMVSLRCSSIMFVVNLKSYVSSIFMLKHIFEVIVSVSHSE